MCANKLLLLNRNNFLEHVIICIRSEYLKPYYNNLVGWGCRIRQLHLLPTINTKMYLMVRLQSLLIDPLKTGLLVLDRVPSRAQIKLFNHLQRTIMIYYLKPFRCVQIIYIIYRLIGQVDRVFANGPGDRGSIPGRVIPKTLKMVFDTSMLNTQQYKVRIKGKVEKE